MCGGGACLRIKRKHRIIGETILIFISFMLIGTIFSDAAIMLLLCSLFTLCVEICTIVFISIRRCVKKHAGGSLEADGVQIDSKDYLIQKEERLKERIWQVHQRELALEEREQDFNKQEKLLECKEIELEEQLKSLRQLRLVLNDEHIQIEQHIKNLEKILGDAEQKNEAGMTKGLHQREQDIESEKLIEKENSLKEQEEALRKHSIEVTAKEQQLNVREHSLNDKEDKLDKKAVELSKMEDNLNIREQDLKHRETQLKKAETAEKQRKTSKPKKHSSKNADGITEITFESRSKVEWPDDL